MRWVCSEGTVIVLAFYWGFTLFIAAADRESPLPLAPSRYLFDVNYSGDGFTCLRDVESIQDNSWHPSPVLHS